MHGAFWRAAFCARWAWAIRAGALRTGAAALHRAADDGRVDVVKPLTRGGGHRGQRGERGRVRSFYFQLPERVRYFTFSSLIQSATHDTRHATCSGFYNSGGYMWATCGNMRGSPRAIRCHSVILAPFPSSESARFGLCIYQTRENRPFARRARVSPD